MNYHTLSPITGYTDINDKCTNLSELETAQTNQLVQKVFKLKQRRLLVTALL